jgi:acyl-CoA synthetase (AMP-forming)/AMP-acid ligase II
MRLANILDQVSRSAATQNNILTDSRITCTYQEIPDLLARIDQFFVSQGIDPEQCLAVECPSSVSGALTILSLLQYGYSFVLLPPAENLDTSRALKPTPQFCQQRLVVKAAAKDVPPTWQHELDAFLSFEHNAEYAHAPHLPVGGKLYLRTSGSMGASKIVVHDHTKLLHNAFNCVQKYAFESTDRVAIPIPISHLYGFGAVFLPAIMVGASIDLQAHSNLLKYLGRERKFDPSIAFLTPPLCDMILRGRKKPRAYKVVVTSGQRIKEDVFRAFDGLCGGHLVDQYGSSEMGAISACNPSDPLDVRVATIGEPMLGVELRVNSTSSNSKNAQDGEVAPGRADIGELQCRHPYGFDGYVDEAGNWLQRAAPGEWYATRDVATQTPAGHIQVVGRADDSINRSGYLVLFSDIERTMEKLEHIEQVVVTKTQGESQRGERIAAFCRPGRGVSLGREQIREQCGQLLPKYAIPDEVFIVDAFPLLPSGKIDRQALGRA